MFFPPFAVPLVLAQAATPAPPPAPPPAPSAAPAPPPPPSAAPAPSPAPSAAPPPPPPPAPPSHTTPTPPPTAPTTPTSTPPTAPTTPPTAPTTPPTRDPSTQQLLPIDPSTGRPLVIDPQTGAVIIPRDPTTGLPVDLVDETGQPIVLRDASGQEIPSDRPELMRTDSLLGGDGRLGSFDGSDAIGRATNTGGTRYRARVGLLEGYTSNAVETQAVTNGPIATHAALFTGLDGSIDLLKWTGEADLQDFRVSGRLQHYVPVDGYEQIDDGTLNGSWNGTFSLGKRTVMQAHVMGTVTSANSALLSDGPLFQIDPSTLTHVYTLENARISVTHDLSKSWRVISGVDTWLGTTISEAPTALPTGGELYHTGLDYVTPGADVALSHDFGPADLGTVLFRYTTSYVAFLLNFASNPPTYSGSAWNQQGNVLATWAHAFNEHFRLVLGAGGAVAQAPPLDIDQSVILSPAANAVLVYTRPYWLATASASYSYGSANPRLGFGPAEGGSFALTGIPFPKRGLKALSIIANGSASRSTFAQGGGVSNELIGCGAAIEGRYAVNRWLGVVGGYNMSYIELDGAGSPTTTVLRNIVFVGLAGYFANDGSLPTLQSFGLAVSPPG